jgi:GT2 family glycosyltransferase
MPPSASVVIVNYNGRALLDSCLNATLPQAAALGAEVILVDNGSTDGSVEYVQDHFPEVVLVQHPRNEGFAAGANSGVLAARSDRIALLNNDAVPEPDWLAELLRALDPGDVAIAASVVEELRYPPTYALGTGTISVVGHPIPNVLPDPTNPFYAAGTSLAFKRDLFPQPFDPLFFAYYEDMLLSWRARLRGFRVTRPIASRVRHVGGATARRRPDEAAFYWERNKLLTLLLCFERSTLLRLIPLYLFDGIARLTEEIWLVVRRHPSRPSHWYGLARHYAVVGRALAWLALHRREITVRRRAIQAERQIPDSAITAMLSGKIFDDYVPTTGHTVANTIALWYCRVVGARTAERASFSPERPSPRYSRYAE